MKPSILAVALFCVVLFNGDRPVSGAAASTDATSCNSRKKNSPQLVKIPRLKNTWQIQRKCKFPSAKHVGFAIDVFYKKWLRQFGDKDKKVLSTLNNMMIEWGEKPKAITGGAFDVNGDPISGTARGLTLMPGYIWIWENRYQRIAATALIHELVHAALWSQQGYHGDPDHEGDEFKGWTAKHTKFIREVNTLLANTDI